MLNGDTITRDVLAELIRGAVDDTVKKQLERLAQEPPISSKIATAIESRLDGMTINGHNVSVVVQDFPDRGRGSWESKSGADLYIGIRVESWLKGVPPVAKGLLIQAKKERILKHSRVDDPPSRSSIEPDVVAQCEKMMARTDKGSFIWIYGAGGARVVPAAEVIKQQPVPPEYLASRNVAEQFRDVLDCFSGDVTLVGQGIFDNDTALAAFLEEIAVRRGVAITLGPPKD